MGKEEEMVPFVIDALVQTAVENGIGSEAAELCANTAITIADVNLHIVSGKIISRLRKILGKTSHSPSAALVEHPLMGEISVLMRFILMLSFNNRLNAIHFLPELFHIISILFGSGSSMVRTSIYGIVINIIHSICTAGNLDQVNSKTMALILAEFSSPKICVNYTF